MSADSSVNNWATTNGDDVFQYEKVMSAKRKRISSDCGSAAAAVATATSKKPAFRQWGLTTRRQEHEELGPPSSQSGCYGCNHMDQHENGATPYEEIMGLVHAIRKSIARTSPIELANFVARRYAEIRDDVNAKLLPGERELPVWSAASILHHLRFHNTDPELQNWRRMVELQELEQIALHASVIQNEETGEIKTDPQQFKIYLEIGKQLEALSRSDLTTKNYYSGGALIDPKTLSEGPISLSGKALVSAWSSS
jgi:hypothetical protein